MISLVRTAQADLDFVLQSELIPENAQFIVPWSREQHLSAMEDSDLCHMCIWFQNRRVGFVLLAGLRSVSRCIEFRRIVVSEKGQGIGRASVQAVKEYAFTQLNAHRLWLDVKQNNSRARSLYHSEAFIEEGTLRECLAGKSGFESLVIMSILAHEYSSRA